MIPGFIIETCTHILKHYIVEKATSRREGNVLKEYSSYAVLFCSNIQYVSLYTCVQCTTVTTSLKSNAGVQMGEQLFLECRPLPLVHTHGSLLISCEE